MLAEYLVTSGICYLEKAAEPLDLNRFLIGTHGAVRLYLKDDANPDAVAKAEAVAQRALCSLDSHQILKALSKLMMLTNRKGEDDDDTKLRIMAFVEMLGDFPGDAVLRALKDWPTRSKWFPAWHELQATIPGTFRRTAAIRLREALHKRRTDVL